MIAALFAAIVGTASFMAPKYGPDYLALPDGPGHRVTICGPAACITRTSTDAGPDKAMQRAGRVADLSFRDFGIVCGCDPWTVGLVRVTVSRETLATLPPTDTVLRSPSVPFRLGFHES